jgi:hypothetical protein
MNISRILEVSESGDYIHIFLEVYLPGYRHREIYTKFNRTTETSRSFIVLNGSVSQSISLTSSECDQINDYILSELLQTA